MKNVEWLNIWAAGCEWERQYQYRYLEVPYMVSREAQRMTFPDEVMPELDRYEVGQTGKVLVGSAEQSFCQMMIDGTMPSGCYYAISPCFRDEIEDAWHQKQFMKLEVINTKGGPDDVLDMVLHAKKVFHDVMSHPCFTHGIEVEIVETAMGYDLEIDGVEIGSYGYRSINGHSWVYGTGMAEPRFSMALGRGLIRRGFIQIDM